MALTPGYSSRKYFDELCQQAGFVPHIAIECDYMMRSYMVMKKIGVALATASPIQIMRVYMTEPAALMSRNRFSPAYRPFSTMKRNI